MEETIDLVRLEQAELVNRLGPSPTTPFGLHVIPGDHPAADLARYVEREVFLEAFGNTPEMLAAEYGEYDASSVFLVVVDHRRRVPAGAVRLILPSEVGHKSLKDLKEAWGADVPALTAEVAGVDPATGRLWDIATLAVQREYRRATARGVVSMTLWQAVGVLSFRCQVDLLVAIIDVRVLRLLHSRLAGVLEPFPSLAPQRYLDSAASVPVWCAPAHWRTRTERLDPDLVRFMVEGTGGMDTVVAPPDWDEAAALLHRVSATGTAAVRVQDVVSSTVV